MPLPFRFVQIKPLSNETNYIDVLQGLLRQKPRNLATYHLHTRCLALPQVLSTIPCVALDSSRSNHSMVTRTTLLVLSYANLKRGEIQWLSTVANAPMIHLGSSLATTCWYIYACATHAFANVIVMSFVTSHTTHYSPCKRWHEVPHKHPINATS